MLHRSYQYLSSKKWYLVFSTSIFIAKIQSSGFLILSSFFLSSGDIGILSLAYSLLSFLTLFISTGIIENLISRLRSNSNRDPFPILIDLLISLFFNFSFVSIILFIFRSYLPREVNTILAPLLLISVVTAICALFSYYFRYTNRNLYSLAYFLFIPTFGFIIFLFSIGSRIPLDTSLGIWSISLLVALAFCLLFSSIGSTPLSLSLPFKDIVHLFPYYFINIRGWFTGYGMTFIINQGYSLSEVGTYAFLLSMSSISQLIVAGIEMSWNTKFIKLLETDPSLASRKSHYIFSLIAILLALSSWLCKVTLDLLQHFNLLSALNEANYQLYLPIMFSAYVVCIPYWLIQDYLTAYSKSKQLLQITLFSALFSLPLWIYLQSKLGFIGIFIGFFTQMLFKSLAALFIFEKSLPVLIPYRAISLALLLVFLPISIQSIRAYP
jgi:O-antigen/teichoic acid export membrane protein